MKKLLLISAATLALAACGSKDDDVIGPSETPAYETPSNTVADNDLDLVELPDAQAALIAAAGSDTIYFATDQYNLEMDARATLEAQARWLIANPNVNASIEGHADERGTREYNLGLGERRANAAREYLASMGVPNNRMTVISWGKERPVALGSNEQAYAQNRRAVTVIVR
ncbi:peptidoglycan-associated lipoprotein Pal [Sphingomicrobium arenosum]|uniref:peptidoglycan-associated lipoprotein Pal n=1 Tax=Sphingomicrobium arenosum TaxID=2233861 RepID=UPI002240EFCE|nr:peptidoglycan-associated lipoprotein Pal [Sphingomicrobium arenosum]